MTAKRGAKGAGGDGADAARGKDVGADPVDEAEGFDERLARLEGIVAELESGDLGLEASIEKYTQGIALLERCHSVLSAHRKRVEELTRDAERRLVDLDDDPDFADEDAE
ncbi:MAG: exodeoxyribonuclease VII small subunit [Planctomycetota bacterium]